MLPNIDCFQLMEHERALRIFIHNLKDFEAAEKYVDDMTSSLAMNNKIREREKLLFTLVSVCLEGSTR